jgi:hypothetical protein
LGIDYSEVCRERDFDLVWVSVEGYDDPRRRYWK